MFGKALTKLCFVLKICCFLIIFDLLKEEDSSSYLYM